MELLKRKFIKAKHGQNGEGGRRRGKDGDPEILEVPPGTVVKDAETGEIIGEVTHDGEELIIANGGRGGLGNWHFRSATNQTPHHAARKSVVEGKRGEHRARTPSESDRGTAR